MAAAAVTFTIGDISVANARTFERDEYLNRDTCFRAVKVPARFRYDTRGTKLRDAGRSWEGNMQRDGALVVNRYNEEVYIQRKEMIEDQHMTLVPVPCRR